MRYLSPYFVGCSPATCISVTCGIIELGSLDGNLGVGPPNCIDDRRWIRNHQPHSTWYEPLRDGRLFLRHLFSLLTAARSRHHDVHLDSVARADLCWWSCFLHHWNGRSFLPLTHRFFANPSCTPNFSISSLAFLRFSVLACSLSYSLCQ